MNTHQQTRESIDAAKAAQARERAEVYLLTGVQIADDGHPEPTDGLFDTSPAHLAEVFGRRTVQMIRDGRDPYTAARLAGSFGSRAIAERPKVVGRITPNCRGTN